MIGVFKLFGIGARTGKAQKSSPMDLVATVREGRIDIERAAAEAREAANSMRQTVERLMEANAKATGRKRNAKRQSH